MDLSLGRLLALAVLGTIGLGVMFLHPVGPILVLSFITPFDGIFFKLFRFVGNLITLIPILVFYMRTPASLWGTALLGTRIQMAVFVWILLLFISHVIAIPHFGQMVFLSFARKLTYVFVLMLFVWYWRDERYIGITIKLFVASMTIFTFLAMLDFYAGIQVLPVSVRTIEGGAAGVEYETWLTGSLRFTAPGLSANRYGGYLIVFTYLAVGWFGWTKNPIEKAVAISFAGVLVVGILCTASRSALLGLVVSGAILAPMAFRVGVREILVGGVALAAFGAVIYAAVSYIGIIDDTLSSRFNPEHVAYSTGGRALRWITAVRVWISSPIWGVGDDLFVVESAKLLKHQPGGKGSHNAYVKLLAETGLIGVIPFVAVMFYVTRSYLASVAKYSPTHEFWRPYFFVGFVGISLQNVFNDYAFERVYWMTWAYAGALEWVRARGRAAERRELAAQNAYGSLTEPGVDPPPTAPVPSPGYG